MSDAQPTVIFGADGWGYGTTTMLLAVAKRLAGQARRVLIDVGETTRLAGPEHFDAFVVAESPSAPPSGDLVTEFERAACVVSVMNTALTWHAHDHGRPSILIEGLGWLWTDLNGGEYRDGDAVRPPSPSTAWYVVERFIGVDEKVAEWARSSRGFSCAAVGPVLEVDGLTRQPDGLVLVNLGGMESWLLTDRAREAFVDLVVAGVLAALPAGHAYHQIMFAAGERAAARIRMRLAEAGRGDCLARTLNHAEFLTALSRSERCISTGGMRTMLEAFTIGVPIAFLPAQNVSHELVFELLARESLCEPDLSWHGRGRLEDVSKMAQEADGCAAINALLETAAADPGEVAGLAARLRRDMNNGAITRRRTEFVRSLGGNGADRIAELILQTAGHRA